MRPSAGIGVVEVQKLELFCVFVGARAALCGDRRGRGAKTRGFCCVFLRCPDEPSAGIGAVEVQKLEDFCARGFFVFFCLRFFACSCKIANFQYKSSTRSTFPQLRLQKHKFSYISSMRSSFPQLKNGCCRMFAKTHSQVHPFHTHGFQCFRANRPLVFFRCPRMVGFFHNTVLFPVWSPFNPTPKTAGAVSSSPCLLVSLSPPGASFA